MLIQDPTSIRTLRVVKILDFVFVLKNIWAPALRPWEVALRWRPLLEARGARFNTQFSQNVNKQKIVWKHLWFWKVVVTETFKILRNCQPISCIETWKRNFVKSSCSFVEVMVISQLPKHKNANWKFNFMWRNFCISPLLQKRTKMQILRATLSDALVTS